MTEQESNHGCKFYCVDCFAYVESECICNRIMGYDIETGIPLIDMTDEEWAYLYNNNNKTYVRQVTAELDLDTNMQTEDTNSTNNTTTDKTKTVPISVLIQLHNAGFRKQVPLLPDSKIPNVHDHLITEEEIKAFPSAEGKPVRIIHKNPNFWTEKRYQDKAHLFYNVATTFGLTDLKDSKGRSLYLYGVDVDTKEAYEALKDLIETLIGFTFVVKSHKEYGYHFYILTPIFHEAMGRTCFKLGAEIEIKTGLSLMHLPPSRHRKYPYWNYQRISTAEQIHIDEEDKVFQEIIKRMSPYLRQEPTEENTLTLDTYSSHLSGSNLSILGLQTQPQHTRDLIELSQQSKLKKPLT